MRISRWGRVVAFGCLPAMTLLGETPAPAVADVKPSAEAKPSADVKPAADTKPGLPGLMVADFEGGKAETVAGLTWPVIADEQLGGASSADLTVFHPGANGTRGALRIAVRLQAGFAAPFAAVVALLGPEGLATDLSAYRGVRFYVRTRAAAGTFNADVARLAGRTLRYSTPLTATPEWSLVELPFDKFVGSAPPGGQGPAPVLVPKDVISVGFSTATQELGQFDLEIDQVEIYK